MTIATQDVPGSVRAEDGEEWGVTEWSALRASLKKRVCSHLRPQMFDLVGS